MARGKKSGVSYLVKRTMWKRGRVLCVKIHTAWLLAFSPHFFDSKPASWSLLCCTCAHLFAWITPCFWRITASRACAARCFLTQANAHLHTNHVYSQTRTCGYFEQKTKKSGEYWYSRKCTHGFLRVRVPMCTRTHIHVSVFCVHAHTYMYSVYTHTHICICMCVCTFGRFLRQRHPSFVCTASTYVHLHIHARRARPPPNIQST
jgi:hypothetical protein